MKKERTLGHLRVTEPTAEERQTMALRADLEQPPMTTREYLDTAKRAANVSSDYALAKVLQISTSRISNYRSGRSVPDDWAAMRLSIATGIDVFRIMRDFRIERARASGDEARAKRWVEHFRQMAARAAALAVLAVGLVLQAPSPAQAMVPAQFDSTQLFRPLGDGNTHMVRLRRRVRRWLAGLLMLRFLQFL